LRQLDAARTLAAKLDRHVQVDGLMRDVLRQLEADVGVWNLSRRPDGRLADGALPPCRFDIEISRSGQVERLLVGKRTDNERRLRSGYAGE
jgi:hypothetical protein